MAIVYNSKNIEHAYYGEKKLNQIYLGSKLVWEDVPKFGDLYAWGDNYYGYLGQGDTDPRYSPTKVSSLSNIETIFRCSYSVYAKTTTPVLYGWGDNRTYQLGISGATEKTTPVLIDYGPNWKYISGAYYTTIGIKDDGTMYNWGYSSLQYDWGDGSGTEIQTPTQIGSASNWVQVGTGTHFAVALNSDGELYSWGVNDCGQLGLGSTTPTNTPTRVGSASDWKFITCGQESAYAINESGEMYSWGRNLGGQLGLNDTNNRNTPTRVGSATNWKYISSYSGNAYALNTDGELFGVGAFPALGLGEDYPSDPYGNVLTFTPISPSNRWKKVSANWASAIALRLDGTLWSWGRNSYGQLGLGETLYDTDVLVPTQIGEDSDWIDIEANFVDFSFGIKAAATP